MPYKFTGSHVDVPISNLIFDPVLQVRAGGYDEEHAADLAEDLHKKAKLPRPWVMDVDGVGLHVCGGTHTARAYEKNARAKVPCVVKKGTFAEAMIAASFSNNSPAHKAKKMTRADKQKAVLTALRGNEQLPKARQLTHRQIAEGVGCSHTMVSDMAAKLDGRDKRHGHAKPEPASPPPPAPPAARSVVADQIGADDWRGMDPAEFLDLPDYVEAVLNQAGVKTVGEIYDHIAKGGDFGLKAGPKSKLWDDVMRLKHANEAAAAGVRMPFDWKATREAVGHAIRRTHEAVARYYGADEKIKREYEVIDDSFGVILKTLAEWEKRLVHSKK